MSSYATDVTEATFQQEVIEASKQVPVLVDFWAPWCGPCRVLKPVLEKLAEAYEGRFRLAKVNSDECPRLSMDYGVRSIPSVKAFVDGELVDEFMGALPESAVREFIDGLMPSPAARLRKRALEQLASGAPEAALPLLDEALALDPRDDAARVAKASALLALGRSGEAGAALDGLSPLAAQDARLAPEISRIRLAVSLPPETDEPALRARLGADPADLGARLALAKLLIAAQRYEPALEELLEVTRRDRTFGDDAGRKTMLQVFDVLGGGHELVGIYRRKLAAALH